MQIEFSIRRNAFHQDVKETLNTEQEILKFHFAGDVILYKSDAAIHPRYAVRDRESAAIFLLFFG